MSDTKTDPKGSRLVELRERLRNLDTEIIGLAEMDSLTEAQETRWEDITTERDTIIPEFEKLEERAARAEQVRNRTFREIKGLPAVQKPAEALFGMDPRQLDRAVARDGALRILEDREQNYPLNSHQADVLDKAIRKDPDADTAKRIIVTENEHYRSAFQKLTTDTTAHTMLTDQERLAMQAYGQYVRAQSEGVTTAGGFAVPVFIDPSFILTDQEVDNPFLTLARDIQVTTNVWKGISGAGVVWSFDAEGAAVSDDSVTLAQPSVTVYMARGFIPYTIEVGEDWAGFQSEMSRLLAEGYDDLLLSKFTNGNGTSEPRGIITALDANTNVEVVVTTDGAFGLVDVHKAFNALGQKYRRRAAWMMSNDVNSEIQLMGDDRLSSQTVNLAQGAIDSIKNRPVYENAYLPDFTGTTGASNIAIVGDWSNYVIARRSGMNVELVPHLFDVTNNRPTGSRALFAYARIGGNSVNDLAFRLLQNQ
jgi:HK97 family phage major capsid protein